MAAGLIQRSNPIDQLPAKPGQMSSQGVNGDVGHAR